MHTCTNCYHLFSSFSKIW